MPVKTVALTFEDGPDPEWTPKVLDFLKSHGLKATFFVVGARASQHPDLVRRTDVKLLRLPYSSTPATLDRDSLEIVKEAAGWGYRVVLADLDSGDALQPGTNLIAASAAPVSDTAKAATGWILQRRWITCASANPWPGATRRGSVISSSSSRRW